MLYSRSRFSWEPSEIGAAKPDGARLLREAPAAFGRLCVETSHGITKHRKSRPAAFGRLCVETLAVGGFLPPARQPPSGGCVLKHLTVRWSHKTQFQPPSGGCVLKQNCSLCGSKIISQPPSGGCVLKLGQGENHKWILTPAAFRRLCVETLKWRENVLAAVLKRSPPPVLKRCLDLPRSNSRSQQNILAKMICCFVNI